MAIATFFLITAGAGLVAALLLAASWQRYLVLVGAGLAMAVVFTSFGVVRSHQPGCWECGGGFFAGLFAAYAFIAWSAGALVGRLIRRVSQANLARRS